MQVETSGLMTGIIVKFELKDFTKQDQCRLFAMALRNLGFDKKLSPSAIKEIDDALIEVSK